ncbi:hypothetical protein ACFWPK_21480 [Nocardia sp. NPDC058519]|uniref:hypothetical protein n=1 Tax=Nocardia sp. NPDC058519 TaxID=3346535 RepID=UPI003668ABC1
MAPVNANQPAGARHARPALLPPQFNDNSKRRIVVEDLLPEVMQWLEQDADRRDAAKESARLRQIAEAERQREAARLAEIQHKENLKAEELRKQASQWAEAGTIRRYLVAMAARVQVIQDEEQRTAATLWLEWCRAHVERLDPLTGVPGPPRNRYMTGRNEWITRRSAKTGR